MTALPLTLPVLLVDVIVNAPISWENKGGSDKRVNAYRTLTHHSTRPREG